MRPLARESMHGALRVPEITVYFWIIKALSTAMGESTSDYLVHAIAPVVAVAAGLRRLRRRPGAAVPRAATWPGPTGSRWSWSASSAPWPPTSCTSASRVPVRRDLDPLRDRSWSPSSSRWQRTEGTLSIHSVDTPRREAFYWAAVVATFALGTAVGDLTAVTLHLGYFSSALLFAGLIAIPAIGYATGRLNPIAGVLDGVRAHPPARRLGRRLAGQAQALGRPGLRETGRSRSGSRADRRVRRIPGVHEG